MNYKRIFFQLLFIQLSSLLFSQNWQQITDFPATERDDGTAFVIGNKAYCGTGQKPGWIPTNDFYSFDMNTDTWDTVASMPAGMERQYSCGFSHGNYGFIVGGKASTYFNDVWMYDALANNWIAKTSLPSNGRMGMCSFVINDTAYIIGGRTSSNLAIDEVWAYSILNDTWVQKNNLPFGERWRAAAVAQNNKGYLLFGLDLNDHFSNELFEYDPLSDSWTLLSTFAGKGRIYTSMFSFSDDLIFMAGLDSLGNNYSDMWRINVDTLNWQELNSIPSTGRRGGICFNSASAIYHTTGIDQNNTRLKETWKVSNPTSILEKERSEKINCYPNPANQFIYVTIDELNNPSVITEIIDITGRIIQKETTNNNFIRINSIDLANGLYNIRIRTKDKIYYSKIIIQH